MLKQAVKNFPCSKKIIESIIWSCRKSKGNATVHFHHTSKSEEIPSEGSHTEGSGNETIIQIILTLSHFDVLIYIFVYIRGDKNKINAESLLLSAENPNDL